MQLDQLSPNPIADSSLIPLLQNYALGMMTDAMIATTTGKHLYCLQEASDATRLISLLTHYRQGQKKA